MQNCGNLFALTSDLEYALYKQTKIGADVFDIEVVNYIPKKGDIFSLLYLKSIFDNGLLIVDKISIVRADFIDQYGTKYSECEE